jgi:cell division protease FtsH
MESCLKLHLRHAVREGRWMNAKLRYFALGVIIVLLLLALFTLFQNPGQQSVSQDISLSQFLNDVDQGKIRNVVIQGQEIHGTYVDGHRFDTYAPNDPTLLQRLYGKSITVVAQPSQDNVPWFVSLLVAWLPFLFTIPLYMWSVRMISRALRTPDGRSIGQVVDECGSELRKSNDRLEQLLNNFRERRDASEQP